MRLMYPFWIILACFMLAWFIRRTLSKKYRPTATRPRLLKACGIAHLIHLIASPFIIVLMMEIGCNRDMSQLRPGSFFGCVLLCALLELFLISVVPFFSIGITSLYILALVCTVVNEYLLRFRDIPFMLMDVLAAEAAGGVVGTYDLAPPAKSVVAFGLCFLNIFFIFAFAGCFRKLTEKRFSYKKSLIAGAASAVAILIIIGNIKFTQIFDIELNMWRPGQTYTENGFITSFVSYAQFSAIGQPEDYSKEMVQNVLSEAEREYDEKYGDTVSGELPTIIDIMDESFTDYTVLGLKCPENHIKYYKSLKDDPNTIWHGYTYVSTYAGGTARSEFEYLTGYSMCFYPNAQPYSQFNFSDIYTSTKSLKALGYDLTAMHPENPTNYRRNTVYKQMEFDRYYYYETFQGYEMSDIVPSRVSDWGDFMKMIDEDNSSEKPQAFHNVTMQNHGGYDYKIPKPTQAKVDPEYADMTELIDFETLITRTDMALENLLNNYRNSDKPTIICFYGDHQPKMPEDFVDERMEAVYEPYLGEVGNQEKLYKVPFLIWANFDVDDFLGSYEFRNETVVSQNYLGAVTRALAGIEISAFDKYLLMLREEIPVINESGYIAGGQWHSHDEENEYTKLIKEYECVQYAGMFDGGGMEAWFSVEGK